jgi:hypothetical protein
MQYNIALKDALHYHEGVFFRDVARDKQVYLTFLRYFENTAFTKGRDSSRSQ